MKTAGMVFFGIIFCMSSALAETKPPAWVTGNPGDKYPGSKYLVTVGSGKTMKEAKEDAKRAMASVFHSEVKSVMKTRAKSELTDTTDAKTEGKDTQETTRDLEISVHVKLEGVEIRETYEQKDAGMYYALAVLDKFKAQNRLRLKMNSKKEKILALKEQFDEKPRSATLDQLDKLLDEYDAINMEYSVFGPALTIARPISVTEFEKMKSGLNDRIGKQKVFVEFKGEQTSFGDAVEACLTEKGAVIITEEDQKKDATFLVSLSLAELDQKIKVEGWVKILYRATADVKKDRKRVTKAKAEQAQSCRTQETCLDEVMEGLSEKICLKVIEALEK